MDTTERLPLHFSLSGIGEGNGNPLQCSCLENPRDGGAWWAAVYVVAQSRTRLSDLAAAAGNSVTIFRETSKNSLKSVPRTSGACFPNTATFRSASAALDTNVLYKEHYFPRNLCFLCACVCAKSLQSYLTLWDPMDCSPPGLSVHGILQAKVLEWGAMAFSIG